MNSRSNSEQIAVHVTSAERQRLEELSRTHGLPKVEVIRRLLKNGFTSGLETEIVELLRLLVAETKALRSEQAFQSEFLEQSLLLYLVSSSSQYAEVTRDPDAFAAVLEAAWERVTESRARAVHSALQKSRMKTGVPNDGHK